MEELIFSEEGEVVLVLLVSLLASLVEELPGSELWALGSDMGASVSNLEPSKPDLALALLYLLAFLGCVQIDAFWNCTALIVG